MREQSTVEHESARRVPDRFCLHVISGEASVAYVLPPAGKVTIGRSSECEVRIADTSASRKHAELRLGAEVTLEDLDSKNGTVVRHRRLAPNRARVLALGDVIEIGDTMLLLQPATTPGPEHPVSSMGMTPHAGAAVSGGLLARLEPLLARLAASDLTLLVIGETGVGKEMVSRLLHERSPRRDKPFVAINCAALPEALIESELFGYERGAFTGAMQAKPGLLESASGGTVLLDEIGEMPAGIQAKLLRVIDTGQVLRIGSLKAKALDVRFLAATNRDLQQEVQEQRFRRDLFFRLNGFTLVIPPLRMRLDELPALANLFAAAVAQRLGRDAAPRIRPDALETLLRHDWPGNIRELRNTVERAVVLAVGNEVTTFDVSIEAPLAPTEPLRERAAAGRDPGDDTERARIEEALRLAAGNQSRAAARLGISRKTLIKRIMKLDLPRPRKGQREGGP
jgi:two-component system, NtrC family, response regulator AtoC